MAYLLLVVLDDLKVLPDLLHAWREAGVPGATILESVGAYRAHTWLERVGLSALERLFEAEEIRRTLLTAIDDEALLARAVAEARGLRKERPGVPEKAPPQPVCAGWREMRIGEIARAAGLEPVTVPPDAPLDEGARALAAHPGVRVACIVTEAGRLVGLLDIHTIAEDLLFYILPMGPISLLILLVFLGLAWLMFRKELRARPVRAADLAALEAAELITHRPLLRKGMIVMGGVIFGSLLHGSLHIESATVALAGATVLLLWIRTDPHHAIREVEWTTLTMIPLVENLGQAMPVMPLWWSLVLGACLGGNATLVGASANVVVAALAERNGHPIRFWRFLGYGVLTTFVSLLLATAYIWLRYL